MRMIVILIIKTSPLPKQTREIAPGHLLPCHGAAAGFRNGCAAGPGTADGRETPRSGQTMLGQRCACCRIHEANRRFLEFSATDLADYLNCRHLSALERAVAEGSLSRPVVRDPFLDTLRERNLLHERNYVEQLEHASEAVDVPFVDEAAQMPLANVLAVSQAGKPSY